MRKDTNPILIILCIFAANLLAAMNELDDIQEVELENTQSDESDDTQKADKKKTTKELWLELGRLLLLLLWEITKKLIRVTYKSIRFAYRFTKKCIEATRIWWNDKSTQEKVRSIRRRTTIYARLTWKWIKKACRKTWKIFKCVCRLIAKYIILFAIAVWKGIVWTLHTLVQLIIHMKPTIIRLRQSAAERRRKMARSRKLSTIRRRRRREAFKRNGGLRGALERKTNSLKSSIQSYMEEEQTEVNPEAITEDVFIEESFEKLEQENRAQAIGKKFFSSIKNIVEEDS